MVVKINAICETEVIRKENQNTIFSAFMLDASIFVVADRWTRVIGKIVSGIAVKGMAE